MGGKFLWKVIIESHGKFLSKVDPDGKSAEAAAELPTVVGKETDSKSSPGELQATSKPKDAKEKHVPLGLMRSGLHTSR